MRSVFIKQSDLDKIGELIQLQYTLRLYNTHEKRRIIHFYSQDQYTQPKCEYAHQMGQQR